MDILRSSLISPLFIYIVSWLFAMLITASVMHLLASMWVIEGTKHFITHVNIYKVAKHTTTRSILYDMKTSMIKKNLCRKLSCTIKVLQCTKFSVQNKGWPCRLNQQKRKRDISGVSIIISFLRYIIVFWQQSKAQFYWNVSLKVL